MLHTIDEAIKTLDSYSIGSSNFFSYKVNVNGKEVERKKESFTISSENLSVVITGEENDWYADFRTKWGKSEYRGKTLFNSKEAAIEAAKKYFKVMESRGF